MNLEEFINDEVEEHLVEILWRNSKMPAARAAEIIRAAALKIAHEHRGPLSKDRFNILLLDSIDPPAPAADRKYGKPKKPVPEAA